MKKLISAAAALAIAASSVLPVFAKTFPDVSEEELPWAASYIDEMSDMGLINGYEDGTFRPSKSVSHQEALALFARAMGSASSVNEEIVKMAMDKYGDKLKSYGIYANEEVAFLLYRGALKESELDTYLKGDIKDAPMQRYEAAIIITKAMGAEKEAVANVLADLSYVDAKDIPASAVQYVYYVTEQKLMQGMGEGKFSPTTDVLRSQMAVMLYNTVAAMSPSFEKAKLISIDTASRNVTIKDSDGETHIIGYNAGTIMNVEGIPTQPKDVPQGVDAIFTYSEKGLTYIDTLSSIPDETIYGKFVGYSNVNSDFKVTIFPTGGSEQKTYTCAPDVSVKYDGSPATIKSFSKDDSVILEMSGGKVSVLSGEKRETTITGATIEDIDIDGDLTITISHALEEYDGLKLKVSSDVYVSKNGSTATLSDVYKGDNVTLTLDYGIITKVKATSVSKTVEGTIKELTISSKPKMVVSTSDGDKTYEIPNDVEIIVNDEEGTLYDFKVGDTVKLTIDSQAITKIKSTSAQTTSKTVTGVVTAVNSSYGFIKLNVTENGFTTEETVFCQDKNAKILTGTAKEVSMKNIKEGQTVTVRGTVKNGAYTANIVIIEAE